MRKALKYAGIGVAVLFVAVAGFLLYAVNTLPLIPVVDTTEAHRQARVTFLSDLPETECLRAEAIIPVAKTRGWDVRPEPPFKWCVRPTTAASWLRVTIDPPLPFSTDYENAHVFAFDARGCAIDWAYASGPGTTCPD